MLRHTLRAASRSLAAPSTHRPFCAAASATAEIPKAVDTPGRYATALYSAANKMNVMDAVVSDVARMQEMTSSNENLSGFLSNPSLPRSAKVDTISEIVSRSEFTPAFSNFMMVMAENGRTADVPKALTAFQEIMASLKGEVVCKVTTTEPLSEWELAFLKKKIKERFFSDKPDTELTVETAIDDELLGGLTVQVGDRFMDLSTRTELRKLQESITQAIG